MKRLIKSQKVWDKKNFAKNKTTSFIQTTLSEKNLLYEEKAGTKGN